MDNVACVSNNLKNIYILQTKYYFNLGYIIGTIQHWKIPKEFLKSTNVEITKALIPQSLTKRFTDMKSFFQRSAISHIHTCIFIQLLLTQYNKNIKLRYRQKPMSLEGSKDSSATCLASKQRSYIYVGFVLVRCSPDEVGMKSEL